LDLCLPFDEVALLNEHSPMIAKQIGVVNIAVVLVDTPDDKITPGVPVITFE